MQAARPEHDRSPQRRVAHTTAALGALGAAIALVLAPATRADTDSCPVDARPIFAGHGFPLDTPLEPAVVESVEAYPDLPGFALASDIVRSRDGTDRIFVLEGAGRIRSFIDDPDASAVTTWLDLRAQPLPLGAPTKSGFSDERGLLGLAFDPDFDDPESPRYGEFYVSYVTVDGCAVENQCNKIVRYSVDDHTASTVDISTGELVFQVEQPWSNHNGGQIRFSPDPADDNLYISIGDGGLGNDPLDAGQDLTTLLGKILRIAVRGETSHAIPPDNPYAGTLGDEEEAIWHWGLRNPYRMWFDDLPPYDLWIGDVGQSRWEEIDRAPGGVSDLNFGWDVCEGNHPSGNGNPESVCDLPGATPPAVEYPRGSTGAVVGGRIYRGDALPELSGQYVFADYSTGRIYSWDRVTVDPDSGLGVLETLVASGGAISAIGEDTSGELLFMRFGNAGRIERLQTVDAGGGTPFPTLLSETGLFDDVSTLTPATGVIEYTINAPLWSDGALKRRFIALPGEETIEFSPDGSWDFPIGTVFVKHFELETGPSTTRLETRIFVRQLSDWLGFTYRWDGSGDAVLQTRAVTFEVEWQEGGQPVSQTWQIPSPAGCLGCHSLAADRVLGVRTGQLNGLDPDGQDQLERWSCRDLFRYRIGPSSDFETWPGPDAPGFVAQEQARAHLASNCAICHQPGGPAQGDMDMRFHTRLGEMNLIGVEASFGDLGLPSPANLIDPGGSPTPHEASVLWQRMASTDPNVRMARGTLLPDTENLTIVADFIDGLPSEPALLDSDLDGFGDGVGLDNCPDVPNPDQTDTDEDGLGDACDPDAAPDLQGATFGDDQVGQGETLPVTLLVDNLGAGDAPAAQLTLYLSEDATIEPGLDPRIGGCRAPAVATGARSSCVDMAVTVPEDALGGGDARGFYWGTCADEPGVVFEADEANNCTSDPVTVFIPEPGSVATAAAVLGSLGWLRARERRRHPRRGPSVD